MERSRGARFDLVQSLEVLHLILDDAVAARALASLAGRLSPRGAPGHGGASRHHRPAERLPRYRSRSFWESTTAALELRIVASRPMYYWLPSGGPANRYLRYAMTRLGPTRCMLSLSPRSPSGCRGRSRSASTRGCGCSRSSGHDDAPHRPHRIRRLGAGARLLLVLRGRLPRDEDLRPQAGGGGSRGRARPGRDVLRRRRTLLARPRRGRGVHAGRHARRLHRRRARARAARAGREAVDRLARGAVGDPPCRRGGPRAGRRRPPPDAVRAAAPPDEGARERRRARHDLLPRGLLRARPDVARVPDRSLARDRQRDAARLLRLPLRGPAALDRRRGDRRGVRGGRSSRVSGVPRVGPQRRDAALCLRRHRQGRRRLRRAGPAGSHRARRGQRGGGAGQPALLARPRARRGPASSDGVSAATGEKAAMGLIEAERPAIASCARTCRPICTRGAWRRCGCSPGGRTPSTARRTIRCASTSIRSRASP